MSPVQPKRRAPRFLAGLQAILHYHGRDFACEAANLSRTGVLLTGDFPRPTGPSLRLSLAASGGGLELKLTGRVVHIEEDEQDGKITIGLDFQLHEERDKTVLSALVSRVVEGNAPAPFRQLKPGAKRQEIRVALEKMPLAHRMALAARANGSERAFLRQDPNPQVLEALARNPGINLTEVIFLARMNQLLPNALETMARDPRWQHDEELKVLLATHPQVTLVLAEEIVASMSELGLKKVVQRPGLHPDLRAKIVNPVLRRRMLRR